MRCLCCPFFRQQRVFSQQPQKPDLVATLTPLPLLSLGLVAAVPELLQSIADLGGFQTTLRGLTVQAYYYASPPVVTEALCEASLRSRCPACSACTCSSLRR